MQGSISQNSCESSERAVSPSAEKKSEEGEQDATADNSYIEISSPDTNISHQTEEVNLKMLRN